MDNGGDVSSMKAVYDGHATACGAVSSCAPTASGVMRCIVKPETCNERDEACDGQIDEDLAGHVKVPVAPANDARR